MKKERNYRDTYEPNDHVKVTVVNKSLTGDEGKPVYARKVTITINAGINEKELVFAKDDSIAKFIETVDFEEPQTALKL